MKLKQISINLGTLCILGLVSGCSANTNHSNSTQTIKSKNNADKSSLNNKSSSTTRSATNNSSQITNSNKGDYKKENLSPKTIGVLVGLLKSPDWFKDNLNGGSMWYGTNWQYGSDQIRGYDFITAKGDPTSYFYFKQNGNDVIIKYIHPQGNQSVAEAQLTTETVSLKNLVNNYYSTSQQQAEVDAYTAQLKAYNE